MRSNHPGNMRKTILPMAYGDALASLARPPCGSFLSNGPPPVYAPAIGAGRVFGRKTENPLPVCIFTTRERGGGTDRIDSQPFRRFNFEGLTERFVNG